MSSGCGTPVTWFQVVQKGFMDVEIGMNARCGDSQTDVRGNTKYRYCGPCETFYQAQFPQGWETYPGDKCVHGKYVGGQGPDLMCPICEYW